MTFKQAIAELKRQRKAVRDTLAYALDVVGQEALRRVIKVWPVDTRKSALAWKWRTDRKLLRGTLSNDVPYVPHVHRGLAARLVPQTFRELEPLFTEIVTTRIETFRRR